MCVLLSYVYLFALLLCMLFHCSVSYHIVSYVCITCLMFVFCYVCLLFIFCSLLLCCMFCFIVFFLCVVFVFFVLVYGTLPPGGNPIAVNKSN
jgi:hypothetical protein